MISVILPVYNEEDCIDTVIEETSNTLRDVTNSWEVIVVDDGSKDCTYSKAVKVARVFNGRVKVVGYNGNMGKGYALRYGFRHSRGDLVFFMDADMEIHPKHIPEFLDVMRLEGADVVVGSKRHPMSKIRYPLRRRVMSELYHLLTTLLFRLNVRDTQTGLKLFKREVLNDVMPKVTVNRYAFDVEIIANAVRKGYKVVEAPVEINYRFDSRVNFFEVLRMLLDTFAIAYRMYVRGYYD